MSAAAAVWLLLAVGAAAEPAALRWGCWAPTDAERGRVAQLVAALQRNDDLRAALTAAGFPGGVALRPAASFRDLVANMRAGRYELASGPATLLAPGDPADSWTVILQERRPGDVWDSRPGGRGTQRQSVLVATRDDALDVAAGDAATSATLVVALMPVESVEGYIAPRLYLGYERRLRDDQIDEVMLDDPDDIVAAVANGLVDVGAVESSAWEAIRQQSAAIVAGDPRAAAAAPRVVARPHPLPTPPICVATQLAATRPDVVRQLTLAIPRASAAVSGDAVRYVIAARRDYDTLVGEVRAWYARHGLFEGLE